VSNQPHELLDRDAILERVGGDVEFLQELAGIFAEDSPRLLQEIRAAITAGDPHGLEYAAHTLKGSIANFGAESARETAFRLEMLGRNGNLAPATEICSVLEREVAQFTEALNSLARQLAQS
jgi:HPt (histidine-containing phosphotransfer) domain-containing protein